MWMASHYWPFMGESHLWSVDSFNKELANEESEFKHDAIRDVRVCVPACVSTWKYGIQQ